MPRIIQPYGTLADGCEKPHKMHTINPNLIAFDEFVLRRNKPSIKIVFCSKRNAYFENSNKDYDLPPIYTVDGCHRERKYFKNWLGDESIEWLEVADELGMRGGSIALDVDIGSTKYQKVIDRLEYSSGEPVSQNMVIWQMDIDVARSYQQAREALLGGEARDFSFIYPYADSSEFIGAGDKIL